MIAQRLATIKIVRLLDFSSMINFTRLSNNCAQIGLSTSGQGMNMKYWPVRLITFNPNHLITYIAPFTYADHKPLDWDEKSWPLWRGCRYREVAVSGGSTVVYYSRTLEWKREALEPHSFFTPRSGILQASLFGRLINLPLPRTPLHIQLHEDSPDAKRVSKYY